MSSLLGRFFSFCILKVLFPDFQELGISFGLYTEEDFERMMLESTHLIRDLMIPIEPQAGAQLGCLFRQATVLHRQYGFFRSCDDPFISHWIRNKVLVMTQSLLLFKHFLGVDYRTIRHPYHPMRRAVASTIKHMFDVILKPVISSGVEIPRRLNQSSQRKPAYLPEFGSIYGRGVFNFHLFSPLIFDPVFDTLRRLVIPFLNGNPNLQMNDYEMAILIIWAALETLKIHEFENEMLGLREIVGGCLSDDRTPTERLMTMSPQTLILLATCNGGVLLRTAIKYFSSQKIYCIEQKRRIALEKSQICAMQDSANLCFQFKPSQRAPQRVIQAPPGPLIPYD
jgi:hypothetical protein